MSDPISRQDAIDAIFHSKRNYDGDLACVVYYRDAIDKIKRLPSAQQKGKWIDRSDGGRILYPWDESHECSQCGHNGSGAWEYCPRCGADMRGE